MSAPLSSPSPDRRRLIAHVVYSFKAGGLENVIVQLINRLPEDRYRHVVIALTEYSDVFTQRVERSDVEFIALKKPPGQIFHIYPQLWRLLRKLRPDVLHTCNLAALEVTPLAWLAGVPRRVHAEHGWVVSDPDGSNKRYRLMRRVFRPFVSQFIAVSRQLRDYLHGPIGVAQARISLLPNGVDTQRFRPAAEAEPKPADWPFAAQDKVVGTVGRLDPVKNQGLLIEACARLCAEDALAAEHLRLLIVGEGEERERLTRKLEDCGMTVRTWMAGSRDDVPALMRAMNCFVLPSLAEGTSCTLQEAMATGLPIVATAVGGSPDVLEQGHCGALVPSNDVDALKAALSRWLHDAPEFVALPSVARAEAVAKHSLDKMILEYDKLFSAEAR